MTLSLDKNPLQLYPEDLLAGTSLPARWRIAKTKSRREKALAGFLCEHGIGYYLPMVKKRQPGKNRTRYSLMPVFSGYLFFRSGELQRYQVFRSGHTANVIDVLDEIQLLKDLNRIKRSLTLDAPVYPYDFVREGDSVEIARGPLKGLQGIVHKKNKQFRLILNVNCLRQSLAVDIEAHWVEPLRVHACSA